MLLLNKLLSDYSNGPGHLLKLFRKVLLILDLKLIEVGADDPEGWKMETN